MMAAELLFLLKFFKTLGFTKGKIALMLEAAYINTIRCIKEVSVRVYLLATLELLILNIILICRGLYNDNKKFKNNIFINFI
jgi:hypothetical protein